MHNDLHCGRLEVLWDVDENRHDEDGDGQTESSPETNTVKLFLPASVCTAKLRLHFDASFQALDEFATSKISISATIS